jgi:hypothetical protein
VKGDAIVIADLNLLRQTIRRKPSAEELRRAAERYLSFRGMGVSDRVPLRYAPCVLGGAASCLLIHLHRR